jgi:hypothetical protein
MPKRQTETKIWSTQRWYRKLHPYHKLVWKYLTDCCDHAGIWKIDYGQLVDDTGIEDFDLAQFIQACNTDFDKETGERIFRERIMAVSKGVLWLTGFIRFQYENKDFQVNPDVPVIKSALQILNGYGILQQALDKGYITLSKPFGIPSKPTTTHKKGVPEEIVEKNDAFTPQEVPNEPENPPPNPSLVLNNPSEPLYNPSEGEEEGSVRTKYKEHNTPPLGSTGKLEEDIEKKSNSKESKREEYLAVMGTGPPNFSAIPEMLHDVEQALLDNPIRFEEIRMEGCRRKVHAASTAELTQECLRKYHLHLEEKQLYPMPKKALFSGFEKWLLNEKNFSNGKQTERTAKASKDAGALELLAGLKQDLLARGGSDTAG